MKKIFAGGALTAVALGGMIAMAPAASAHTPNVFAKCETDLVVDLKAYQDATVTVSVDGETVESTDFFGKFEKTYDLGDATQSHDWSVSVVAHDDNRWNRDFGDTVPACEESTPTPTEAPAPEPTPEPTVPAETPTPDATVPADEPTEPAEEPSPEPSTAAPVEDDDSELAATGATVGGAAAFALLLVGGGAALVIARKRMAKN